MAKKQTRRSISVRGVTYNQLRDYCAGASISMSDFIEQRIADFFVEHPVAASTARPTVVASAPAPVRAPAPRPQPVAQLPERKPAPAARVEPVLPAPLPRPVPASSTINRPVQVAARRAVSPPPMATISPISSAVSAPLSVSQHGAVGRPAPTPAAEVLKERLTPAAPRDAKDYRAIRF